MPRKSLSLPLLLLLLASPLLLAMGGGGGAPVSDTIPRPQDNHRASLMDRQGVSIEVSHLSCDGKTFFPLRRGEGTLMVPFAKVKHLALGQENGDVVSARVVTGADQALDGVLGRSLLLTGATDFGNYRVELRGLQEISFH